MAVVPDKAREEEAEAEAGAGGPGGGNSSTQAPVVLQNGQVIQNYEIVKPLGKGKFSIVYMAKRLTDSSMCALKKINIFDIMVPKQREKCLKEVRLLQSLDHPNIVSFKESFIDNNDLFIIVEWAEKGDLKRLIRRAISMDIRFKDSEIWEYSRQLASALDHMHQKRIMHRDLKPANIFVAMDGSLKLGDLGLGRFFSSQTLEAFSKVGTPLYMSPEVLRGAGYDMRSDVWSLGCVLYELPMLRSPFKSEQQLSLYDLFVRISKGEYPPLPETVSQEFRELVGWTLALDSTKRADCAQVLEVCTTQVAALRAQMQKLEDIADKAKPSVSSSSRVCRPSPLLVMDDIVEKLKLLECEEQFLRPRGYPLLHRCFFVQKVPLPGKVTQFEIMYELIGWLLQQREEAADVSAGPPCKAPSRNSISSGTVSEADAGAGRSSSSSQGKFRGGHPAQLTSELVHSLSLRGIHISSESTLSQIQQGYGEGVCLILNELINQELVGRDFHFEEPSWSEAITRADTSADLAVEEVDEDLNSESGNEHDECGESEGEFSALPGTAIVERPQADSKGVALDPIYEAHVDPAAWQAEVNRVRPLLKISPDVSGWRRTVATTRELCSRTSGLCQPLLLPQALTAACKKWQNELEDLRCFEDRLNVRFSALVTDTAHLRSEAARESEIIFALQSSIADQSEVLRSLIDSLEKQQQEAVAQSVEAMDAEQLPRLRKAFQHLRQQTRELELRIGCVQADLFERQREKVGERGKVALGVTS
mmetsp:Transcript_113841/g.179166  ORF Transcript_113841/g.179166 Transcript_113841/m.179166 type:complete len:763 (-) Transcript_113841:42-2330(-)